MLDIRIYSTPVCPNCKALKTALESRGVPYQEVDLSTPQALTELAMQGVFATAAPVLQVGNRFYTPEELFPQGRLNNRILEELAASK